MSKTKTKNRVHAIRSDEKVITVQECAVRVGKTDGRIRQICREHNIGVCYGQRLRMLSENDVNQIETLIAERGKNFQKN